MWDLPVFFNIQSYRHVATLTPNISTNKRDFKVKFERTEVRLFLFWKFKSPYSTNQLHVDIETFAQQKSSQTYKHLVVLKQNTMI